MNKESFIFGCIATLIVGIVTTDIIPMINILMGYIVGDSAREIYYKVK